MASRPRCPTCRGRSSACAPSGPRRRSSRSPIGSPSAGCSPLSVCRSRTARSSWRSRRCSTGSTARRARRAARRRHRHRRPSATARLLHGAFGQRPAQGAGGSRTRISSPIWKAGGKAKETIASRLPSWRLAERLVGLGAAGQASAVEAVRTGRTLLAEPDPLPPIVQAAADDLRARLNAAWKAWEAAWAVGRGAAPRRSGLGQAQHRPAPRAAGEPCVSCRSTSPRWRRRWRSRRRSTSAASPPGPISPRPCRPGSPTRSPRRRSCWSPRRRSSPCRAARFKTEAELDAWLAQLRTRIAAALADGPVIPKV